MLSYKYIPLALAAIGLASASVDPNSPGGFVCSAQNEHCIFVNGDYRAYSVEYKSGSDSSSLVCKNQVLNKNGGFAYQTGPCKTNTNKSGTTVTVQCRDPDNAEAVRPDSVDITFYDDSHGSATTHGDRIWVGFQGSGENRLQQGTVNTQYPHVSAVVNCFGDNPYGA